MSGTASPFQYNPDLLAACALDGAATNACEKLFNLHAQHFGYAHLMHDENHPPSSVASRFDVFCGNARQVYRHNYLQSDVSGYSLTLNQFSHLFEDEKEALLSPGVDTTFGFPDNSIRVNLGDLSDSENSFEKSFDWNWREASQSKWSGISHETKKFLHGAQKKYQKYDTTNSDGLYDFLNWASDENPDGTRIVHTPVDQGSCGSCWAIVTTGAVEASVVRNAGFVAFTKTILQLIKDGVDYTNKTEVTSMLHQAKSEAMSVEERAFPAASLSFQELLDCDTKYDQGCVGGNPMIAFSFVSKYGLASSFSYPYVDYQQQCQMDKADNPIATMQSFGILPSYHEKNMAKVMGALGPIAVGLSVTDPSFMHYESGIYNSSVCTEELNHALLLVGYGEEPLNDGTNGTQKYWIARNSWGEGWGEGGYVRLARSGTDIGRTGSSVCGIGIDPSIPLGASFISDDYLNNQMSSMSENVPTNSLTQSDCVGLQCLFDRVEFQFKHYAILFLSILCCCALFSCCSKMRQGRVQRKDEETATLVGSMKNYGSSEFHDPRRESSFTSA